jgi:hypothetical protein
LKAKAEVDMSKTKLDAGFDRKALVTEFTTTIAEATTEEDVTAIVKAAGKKVIEFNTKLSTDLKGIVDNAKKTKGISADDVADAEAFSVEIKEE